MADADAPLALVLALIRSTDRMTRPELVRQSGLSRAVVNQRVEQALELRLVEETSESISTGGRPSTTLRVRDQQGRVLAAVFGASRLHIAVTDLSGRVLRDRVVSWDVDAGPEASLTRLESLGRALLDEEPTPLWAPPWCSSSRRWQRSASRASDRWRRRSVSSGRRSHGARRSPAAPSRPRTRAGGARRPSVNRVPRCRAGG